MRPIKPKKPKYCLNSSGEFIIENYNNSKPLANFFPGIAGKYGIPMWVFYVNRGQAIASFGTKSKNSAILEFFPANKSWQFVSSRGFRTFLKVFSDKTIHYYEPFTSTIPNLSYDITNQMLINSYSLRLEENNLTLGLQTKIEYFTIPNAPYAGLIRIFTLTNLTKTAKKIQLLDGLPQIVPFGTSNLFLKKLGRTIEAWMNVENLDMSVPFYKLDVDPTDRPEVIRIVEGNFYLCFCQNTKNKIIKPIVDPQCIFGTVTDFSFPQQFLNNGFSLAKNEITKNKTPCAMSLLDFKLGARQQKAIYSVTGYMRNKDMLNALVPEITSPGYLEKKKEENKNIILELQSKINTESGSPAFDYYCKQTYLDNIMRGGFPTTLELSEKLRTKYETSPIVFYLYSRKHGDLERDYNKFQIQPTYFSQGNGNYRDANQNRRCDIWFNPQINEENILTFFNLIQADGYNPLVIKNVFFTLKNSADLKTVLRGLIKTDALQKIISFLSNPFTPGRLILFIEENKIKFNIGFDDLLNIILSHCQKKQDTEHAEGFWTDHWTYNLDLLESFLNIYPERLKDIIFEKKLFTFYDNSEVVKPRKNKYVLKDKAVKQLGSVESSNTKMAMIEQRKEEPYTLRKDFGKGEIYHTTMINKMICLFVNKLASLDPFGVGIEMEADKPNWFDALNGLPAMFGSSLNETLELKRLILFITWAINKAQIGKICVAEEIYEFFIKLSLAVQEYLNDNSADKEYSYWEKSNALKEEYREKIKLDFSGKEQEIHSQDLVACLNNAIKKLDIGINKAKYPNQNIYYGYFINEVKKYELNEHSQVIPKEFLQKKLPLFLEPQVHALRLSKKPKQAKAIYLSVKKSQLYDKKLKMYKVTTCLKEMPPEIGRCRVFSPGWLEHQSIWLHMEYKYLLETLKSGLYEEFYQDFKNVLIPFQPPQRYGRSILENSSFLVSSDFIDKSLHGNGFVARLSGSTAEFLQIWLTMNLGLKPFVLDNNARLNLQFKPILKSWLFTKKTNIYHFNFLGEIKVTYHNPKRKDTFGKHCVTVSKIIFFDKDSHKVELSSDTIPHPYAQQIRARQIKQIDIFLY